MLTQLWIDTDVGVDDAQGIMLAATHPAVRIVGISTVHGNTTLDNVDANVRRVLAACGCTSVLLARGAAEPLLCDRTWVVGTAYHGSDGMGDAADTAPTRADVESMGDWVHHPAGVAAAAIVDAARECGGRLTLLALGPLTNVALAVKLCPELPSMVERLIVMGGAHGPGNVSPHAEFNFHCDPEAAKIVLQKFPSTLLVPRDVGMAFPLPWAAFEDVQKGDNMRARFFASISRSVIESAKAQLGGMYHERGFTTHDPQAVGIAIAPHLMTASRHVYCDIEVQGSHLTRGMSVFDDESHLGRASNVQLVTGIDVDGLMAEFRRALS
ncbi:hypothetical protein FOA52_008202 [Chlamydomonas sp. UWO 241]|nr:hypothetical protein FOA52_008202 [Chlamydomonas sp. UWO 241]